MGKAEGEKTEHWSYFGKNGIVYTGWKKMGKAEGEKTAHWSYFGSNGWLRTGWVQLGKGTLEPDGNVAKHWSYFGSNGWLRTGWVQFGKGTSEPDGNAAKHWSYFGDNGWMRTGWQDMGKATNNPDGNSAKHRSYFGDNGWMRTGTQIISDRQYTFDGRGWLLENYADDVFMNYLRDMYKKNPSSCLRFHIFDFDHDGEKELVIEYDYDHEYEIYKKNGASVKKLCDVGGRYARIYDDGTIFNGYFGGHMDLSFNKNLDFPYKQWVGYHRDSYFIMNYDESNYKKITEAEYNKLALKLESRKRIDSEFKSFSKSNLKL